MLLIWFETAADDPAAALAFLPAELAAVFRCCPAAFFISPQVFMATVEKFNGYAIVTIKKEPVNSMDLDLWKSLQSALDVVEADGKMKGVIFKSGLKRDVIKLVPVG